MEPIEFLSLALDPVRLYALGMAAARPVTADDVAQAMAVSHREALEAIGALRVAGLIDDAGNLLDETLRELGARIPADPEASPQMLAGSWSEEERGVLSTFFSGRRLVEIPASRRKRLVVLERLAQEFEPGVRYSEREVSFQLQLFHPDYASLRRHLVDEGMLTRSEGVYWRTSGRYDPV